MEVHPGIYPLANNYGKSPFLMGKSTMSMIIFNSYVCLTEGKFFAAHIYIARVFPVRIYLSCNIVIYVLNWDARSSGLV